MKTKDQQKLVLGLAAGADKPPPLFRPILCRRGGSARPASLSREAAESRLVPSGCRSRPSFRAASTSTQRSLNPFVEEYKKANIQIKTKVCGARSKKKTSHTLLSSEPARPGSNERAPSYSQLRTPRSYNVNHVHRRRVIFMQRCEYLVLLLLSRAPTESVRGHLSIG